MPHYNFIMKDLVSILLVSAYWLFLFLYNLLLSIYYILLLLFLFQLEVSLSNDKFKGTHTLV